MEERGLKKIAALTMVRNDNEFLARWVSYYGEQLGRDNIFVYFDGEDQVVPDFCKGIKVKVLPRQEGDVVATDRARARFISSEASRLMKELGYEMALGTDVDEFLIADPLTGKGLRRFLSDLPHRAVWSGLGVDVGQTLGVEQSIDWSIGLFAQRSRGWLYSRYTKATVISAPLTWGSGYHRVKGHDFKIAKDLYLFHLGGIDLDRIKARCADPEGVGEGWSRHLKKRARTITAVSRCKVRPWYPTVERVRMIEQLCRPIFAWNKPTTFGMKFVVEIPERFKNLI